MGLSCLMLDHGKILLQFKRGQLVPYNQHHKAISSVRNIGKQGDYVDRGLVMASVTVASDTVKFRKAMINIKFRFQ